MKHQWRELTSMTRRSERCGVQALGGALLVRYRRPTYCGVTFVLPGGDEQDDEPPCMQASEARHAD